MGSSDGCSSWSSLSEVRGGEVLELKAPCIGETVNSHQLILVSAVVVRKCGRICASFNADRCLDVDREHDA